MKERNYQVDMHIHTTASDGTWTVEELLKLILESNIKLFSITDHDSIQSSVEMLDSVPGDIGYIIGSEISCTYNNQEYHIAAYDFDIRNPEFNELIQFNQKQRKEFNTKVIEFVKQTGKIKDITDYFSYKYDSKRGGWDSLNYLLDKGIIKDMGEYFKIINSSDEELSFKSPKEVIEVIKNAGGYSFLAHPSAYVKGDNLSIKILNQWKEYGICGIECYSPYLRDMVDADYYIKFCNENNLMISVGSDCHGEFNDRTLGIPKVNIDKLKLDFIRTV